MKCVFSSAHIKSVQTNEALHTIVAWCLTHVVTTPESARESLTPIRSLEAILRSVGGHVMRPLIYGYPRVDNSTPDSVIRDQELALRAFADAHGYCFARIFHLAAR